MKYMLVLPAKSYAREWQNTGLKWKTNLITDYINIWQPLEWNILIFAYYKNMRVKAKKS